MNKYCFLERFITEVTGVNPPVTDSKGIIKECAFSKLTQKNLEYNSLYIANNFSNLLQAMNDQDVNYCYVLNGPRVFGYIDSWADAWGIPDFNEIKEQNKRIDRPTIKRIDTEANVYIRQVWLNVKYTRSRHSVLRKFTFVNFSAITSKKTLKENAKIFNIDLEKTSTPFRDIAIKFNTVHFDITGDTFFVEKGNPPCTAGALARSYYLDIAKTDLRGYQNRHRQSCKFDYLMRSLNLLPPGIVYVKDVKFHDGDKLYMRYDKNSLFPYCMDAYDNDMGGFISIPVKAYFKEQKENCVYILHIKNAVFKIQYGRPHILANEYPANEKGCFTISEQAFYSEYWDCLTRYYKLVDYEIEAIYEAAVRSDPAVKYFVSKLYAEKQAARAINQSERANFVKLLLNNLHGKFAQGTTTRKFKFDTEDGCLQKVWDEDFIDEWATKHFHFTRGAYIYTLAKCEMFEEIFELEKKVDKFWDTLLYIDTDCFVTSKILPLPLSDRIGEYKVDMWTAFQAFTLVGKMYGYTSYPSDANKLTLAGLDGAEILAWFECHYPELKFKQICEKLMSGEKFTIWVLSRIIGGTDYVPLERPLLSDVTYISDGGDGLI